MEQLKRKLKICDKGHSYYKSSDCPTCPFCENERKPKNSFLSKLAAPARRALENNRIFTIEELSQYSETEILKFHGIGKASMPKLREALGTKGLAFKP